MCTKGTYNRIQYFIYFVLMQTTICIIYMSTYSVVRIETRIMDFIITIQTEKRLIFFKKIKFFFIAKI